MNVLVCCEFSATVRDAFIKNGHFAMSVDLLDTDGDPLFHHKGDMFKFIESSGIKWDLIITHPDCTYITVSGLHWNKKDPSRSLKTDYALQFVERIWKLPVDKLCIENPVGCINSRMSFMPKPQYIQPYDFDEDASKKTGLWTRGLPKLTPTIRRGVGWWNTTVNKWNDGLIKRTAVKTIYHLVMTGGDFELKHIKVLLLQWLNNGVLNKC